MPESPATASMAVVRLAPAPLILLVDDHPAVRRGLALVLEAEGVGRCREACGRAEALEAIAGRVPDVAVVNLSTSDEETYGLIADLRARHVPVLVCSRSEHPAHVERAIAAGARGYITRPEAPQEIGHAVRGVLEGWLLISPRAAEGLEGE